jgi:hypothetical protein
VRPREDSDGQVPESLTQHTVSACTQLLREAHADVHLAKSYTMAGTNPFSSAAQGAHPIRVPPVRPLYAVAARGLGASMWFFVCSCPGPWLDRASVTNNPIHSSCSEHTTTAPYFSASSTPGTTERASTTRREEEWEKNQIRCDRAKSHVYIPRPQIPGVGREANGASSSQQIPLGNRDIANGNDYNHSWSHSDLEARVSKMRWWNAGCCALTSKATFSTAGRLRLAWNEPRGSCGQGYIISFHASDIVN